MGQSFLSKLTIINTCCNLPTVHIYHGVLKSMPSVSQWTKCSDSIIIKRCKKRFGNYMLLKHSNFDVSVNSRGKVRYTWKMIKKRFFWSAWAASSFSSRRSTCSSVGFSLPFCDSLNIKRNLLLSSLTSLWPCCCLP